MKRRTLTTMGFVTTTGFVVFVFSLGMASAQEQRDGMAEIPPAMTLTADNATPGPAPDEQAPGQPAAAASQSQAQAQQNSTIPFTASTAPAPAEDQQSNNGTVSLPVPPQANYDAR